MNAPSRRLRAAASLTVATLLVALGGCGDRGTGGGSSHTSPPAVAQGTLEDLEKGLAEDLAKVTGMGHGDYVMWHKAGELTGQVKRVCGPVSTIRFDVGDTHVLLGKEGSPEQFGIVVWDDPAFVEELAGREDEPDTACISGKIIKLDGIPQIETRTAKDLWLS